jgi:hypothetical protein
MANKVIVMVSDLDDAIHGEINVLESPDQAAHFVESLIESGFDQQRIRVFLGGEMEMEVHHRPVVSLNPRANEAMSAPAPAQAEAPEASAEATEERPVAASSRARTLRIEEVGIPAEPFVKNGVRFSSQFRPA